MSAKTRAVLAVLGLALVLLWVTWRTPPRTPAPASSTTALTPGLTATPAATTAAPVSSDAPEVSSRGRIAKEARLGTNAADLYKDALALWKTLTPEEIKMISNPRDEVDAAAAEALFKKIQPIMDLLRRAQAEAAYTDWGLGPLRFDTAMPHLSPIMNLGKLAAWGIAYRAAGDPEGAVADLSAEAYLAGSVKDQALIGYLVGSAIENLGAMALAQNLGSLTPAALAQATELLQTLSPSADLAPAMEAEAQFSRSIIETLADPKTRDQTWQLMMMGNAGGAQPAGPAPDPAALRAQTDWLAGIERDFPARVLAPEAEFNAWWSKAKADAAALGPLAASILPTLEQVRANTQNAEVRRAMLLAALAAAQTGPAAVAAIADPVTGQPFAYVPTDSGFELRSTFTYKGRPVTMSFRQPSQP